MCRPHTLTKSIGEMLVEQIESSEIAQVGTCFKFAVCIGLRVAGYLRVAHVLETQDKRWTCPI